ncbi:MAG: RNA polymerase sigma factor [Candidatus Kerfeldbacteria bacterium]
MEFEHLKEKTDEELVALAIDFQAAFSTLIDRYSDKLTWYIRQITNVSREEAEDILQETFIKAYTNINSFDPSLKFSSWIYRIAHNEVISNYRKRKARPQDDANDIDDKLVDSLVAEVDLDKEVDREFLRKHLLDILGGIDMKYREVLVLRYFQDRSYKEISDIIKKPEGTVATLINRAKKECRKQIEKKRK